MMKAGVDVDTVTMNTGAMYQMDRSKGKDRRHWLRAKSEPHVMLWEIPEKRYADP